MSRLFVAAPAVISGFFVALMAALSAGGLWLPVLVLGLVGAAVLAFAVLTARPTVLVAGLLPLGAAIVVRAFPGSVPDAGTIVLAALLLVSAELGYWSAELDQPAAADPGLGRRRAMRIGLLVAGTAALDGCCLAGVLLGRDLPLGLPLVVLGAVAALVALALPVWLAWRRTTPRDLVPPSPHPQRR